MSLPFEQSRALENTRQFLGDLCNPSKTKRVPKILRQRSRSLLKHFPSSWDLPRIVGDAFAMRQLESLEETRLGEFWDK